MAPMRRHRGPRTQVCITRAPLQSMASVHRWDHSRLSGGQSALQHAAQASLRHNSYYAAAIFVVDF